MNLQELVAVCNVPPIDNTELTMMQSLVLPPKFWKAAPRYASLADMVRVLQCAHFIMDMYICRLQASMVTTLSLPKVGLTTYSTSTVPVQKNMILQKERTAPKLCINQAYAPTYKQQSRQIFNIPAISAT